MTDELSRAFAVTDGTEPPPMRGAEPDFYRWAVMLARSWEHRARGVMAGRELQQLIDALRKAHALGRPASPSSDTAVSESYRTFRAFQTSPPRTRRGDDGR